MYFLRENKVRALLGIIIVMLLSVAAWGVARAEGWAWSSGVPVAVSKENASAGYLWRNVCEAKFQSIKREVDIEGTESVAAPKSECLMAEGDGYELLSFSNNNAMAVRFTGDRAAHMIRGIECEAVCVYMPSRDTLIKVETNNDLRSGRVAMYKNFVSKLQRKDTLTDGQRYYEFPQSTPDKLIGDPAGIDNNAGFIKHLQKSANDNWLVVEFVSAGLVRIDMNTMQVLKFSDLMTGYWHAGPEIEFAITNDGQRVAAIGLNTQNEIYDITSACGNVLPQRFTDSDLLQPIGTKCGILQLTALANSGSTETFMPNMQTAYQPKFSDDGGEIAFYATSSNAAVEPRRIKLRAANYTGPPPLEYLALGDSFASGEGDTETSSSGSRYYRANTDENGSVNIPQEKCHLSTRSYPYLLAKGMGLSLDGVKKWNSVACSGATVWDVKEQGAASYLGQGDRLKGFGVSNLKSQALNEFIPGRQKQIEFVKKYQPRVITLTMGGNDIGFGEKITECVSLPATCRYANSDRNEVKSQIENQFDNLKRLYEELFQVSNTNIKLYVIGYPNIVNGISSAQCDLNVGFLDPRERELIQNGVSYLNNVIKQAAGSAGAKYVDIENSLNGHRLCDSGTKYVNGLTDALNWNKNRQESIHPNAQGHNSMTLSVWDNVWNSEKGAGDSLIDYDVCPGTTENRCPNTSATKENIEIPVYFAGLDSGANTKSAQMTSSEQRAGSQIEITHRAFTFTPNSTVKLVMHSDPVDLGEFKVSSDGSISVNELLPGTIPVGFHTLIMSGSTYSGDPIEYAQSVLVKGVKSDDIDNDGIADSMDKCLFIPASGVDADIDSIDDACDATIGDPPATPSPTPTPSPSTTPNLPPVTQPNPVRHIITTIFTYIATVISSIMRVLKLLFRL